MPEAHGYKGNGRKGKERNPGEPTNSPRKNKATLRSRARSARRVRSARMSFHG